MKPGILWDFRAYSFRSTKPEERQKQVERALQDFWEAGEPSRVTFHPGEMEGFQIDGLAVEHCQNTTPGHFFIWRKEEG
nr:hypothetical protein [Anaerolineae bacterium]